MTGFWLPAGPLVVAVLGFALLRRGPRTAAVLAVAGGAAALVAAVAACFGSPWLTPTTTDLATVQTGGPAIHLAATLDGLAVVVAVMVGAVSLLVQLYSVEYLRGDPRYPTYAAFVSLFTAAMLLVVVAGDLVVLLVGWEVMGLCSYVLIGHHRELPEARAAALKAFLTTRLGDAGFVVGVIVLGWSAGSFRIADVLAAVPHLSSGTVTAAALLLGAGVVGKSAQFPLHVWLPDAMAGPTPVSALIHAATMVAAGVFAVARLYPVFLASPTALAVLGVVAAITMLGAALAALAQDDIKRVLAYSTVSQLAYMIGALACGGRDAALYHLLVHAAFKALGFLAAGAVIHAVGSNLMTRMGGLARPMRVTAATMTIALASGAGVVPLAGFFSKESVVSAAERAARGEVPTTATWVGWLVLVSALTTVAVTAAYSARLLLMTFGGDYRGTGVPHEAPALMRWPLVVLAVPAAGLGVLALSADWLPTWLGPVGPTTALTPNLATAALSLLLVVLGAGAVWLRWRPAPDADPVAGLGRLRPALESGFGVDAVYERVLIRPLRVLAKAVVLADNEVVSGVVQGSGGVTVRAAFGLRRLQSGNAQSYLTGALAGVSVLLVVAVVVMWA
ncbi:MAG: NADH-quinone oxidoreductase subunit L [Actinomycetes bacterium]